MPKKTAGGSTPIDLLAYMFGSGEREDLTNPHLVAARAPARITLADLVLLLDAPVEALRGKRPAEHV
ncbi:hypothetical protein [Streptomyces nojiriensis]|uniref:hypothetical protein n=1 Tax=Streptomyces nojiriensis TaxID=66374 RepID=UPI00364DF081